MKVSEDLQAGGFSDTQSRTLVHAIANTRDELASKADIDVVKGSVDALKKSVVELKRSVVILQWMVGMLYPLVVAILISLIFR